MCSSRSLYEDKKKQLETVECAIVLYWLHYNVKELQKIKWHESL